MIRSSVSLFFPFMCHIGDDAGPFPKEYIDVMSMRKGDHGTNWPRPG